MKIKASTNDRASSLTIEGDAGGTAAVAFVPAEMYSETSPIAPQSAALATALPIWGERLEQIIKRFGDGDGRRPELTSASVRNLAEPFQALQQAGRSEAAAIDAAASRVRAYRVGDVSLHHVIVSQVLAMSVPEQARWAQTAPLEHTSALQAAGREMFRNMPDDVWELVDRRHGTQAWLRMTGLQAEFARKPSAAEPLAYGADPKSAELYAENAMKRHDARSDLLALADSSLRSIVDAVALVTGETRDEAYRLLTTEAA